MKRSLSVILAILIIAALAAGCRGGAPAAQGTQPAASAKPASAVTLSVGTYSPSTSADGQSMEFFKKYAEEKSGGKILVNVYHNNQLGNTNAQIEGVIMGSQDIFLSGVDPLMQWAPEIKYCSVSYLFQSDEHLKKFLQSDLLDKGRDTLAGKNIMFLDDQWTFKLGPFRVLVSTKPINSFSDLKGMKVRVPEVETLQKTWAAFGCAPITMAFSEVYLGLEQGMIQAFEVPMNTVKENSYCEVAKYVTKTDSFPQRYALIMSKSKFESLPADLQKVLRDAAYAAGAEYTRIVEKNFESDKEFLTKELKVTFVDNMDLKPFRDAMSKLYAEWEGSGYFEKGIVEKIKALA